VTDTDTRTADMRLGACVRVRHVRHQKRRLATKLQNKDARRNVVSVAVQRRSDIG